MKKIFLALVLVAASAVMLVDAEQPTASSVEAQPNDTTMQQVEMQPKDTIAVMVNNTPATFSGN